MLITTGNAYHVLKLLVYFCHCAKEDMKILYQKVQYSTFLFSIYFFVAFDVNSP